MMSDTRMIPTNASITVHQVLISFWEQCVHAYGYRGIFQIVLLPPEEGGGLLR